MSTNKNNKKQLANERASERKIDKQPESIYLFLERNTN